MSDEFDERVKTSFPVGSSLKAMAIALRRQGFSRQDWGSLLEQEHEAMRREDNFVCRQAAYVHWRTDGEERLTSVRGAHREEDCL